ncbi:hypothetical protein BaRGS_00030512 [Batillaria attramentaria]|uniref:Sulfotransferase domain-containing protein n=1 Tax=Batillaria attramentaria TaxID=370345 RepID=A0ABD0JUA1_9CAEN
MPAVEVLDEDGNPFLMRDADGLFVSQNVVPDLMERQHGFQARDDDVVLVTYPKSGTHWAWEIISMLTQRSHNLLADTMKHIDYMPLGMLDAIPSPRVLSTHLPFSRLPRDFLSRGCKIVWVVRNPADVAVSFYAFCRKLQTFGYSGQWKAFWGLYLDGTVPYGSWFEHTQEWMSALEARPNILLVRYEDLLSNFRAEVSRIASFLEVQVTDAMLDAMQRETSFENMSQNKFDFTAPLTKDGTPAIYRNGKSNEWRSVFTKEQTAQLESAYLEANGGHHHKLGYTFQ